MPALGWVLVSGIVTGWPRAGMSQDFDPAGRRHRSTAPPTTAPGPTPTYTAPKSPKTESGDGQSGSGPGAGVLIPRYTAIVLAQPTSPFPLQRLAQLYRERDGNLKRLIADFEKRAADAGPEQWNAKIVLAALYREDGRPEDAVKTYESAIAARPKDPAPMLALAQLARDRNDPTAAKRHYGVGVS